MSIDLHEIRDLILPRSLGFSLATLSFIVVYMHAVSSKTASKAGSLVCKVATGLIGTLAALAFMQIYRSLRLLAE